MLPQTNTIRCIQDHQKIHLRGKGSKAVTLPLQLYILTSGRHQSTDDYCLLVLSNEKKHVEYNLRTKNLCKLPTIRSTSFGLESLSFRGNFLWNTLNDSIKNEPTLPAFKNKIKNWSGKNAPAGFAANLTLKYIIIILYIVIWFSFSLYCK